MVSNIPIVDTLVSRACRSQRSWVYRSTISSIWNATFRYQRLTSSAKWSNSQSIYWPTICRRWQTRITSSAWSDGKIKARTRKASLTRTWVEYSRCIGSNRWRITRSNTAPWSGRKKSLRATTKSRRLSRLKRRRRQKRRKLRINGHQTLMPTTCIRNSLRGTLRMRRTIREHLRSLRCKRESRLNSIQTESKYPA